MFKLIGWVLKLTVFAVLVLTAGNYFHWGSKTVNDEIRTQLSHAERPDWSGKLKEWTGTGEEVSPRHSAARHRGAENHARNGNQSHPARPAGPAPGSESEPVVAQITTGAETVPPQEKVSPSERQKLRALIQELNTSHHSTARN